MEDMILLWREYKDSVEAFNKRQDQLAHKQMVKVNKANAEIQKTEIARRNKFIAMSEHNYRVALEHYYSIPWFLRWLEEKPVQPEIKTVDSIMPMGVAGFEVRYKRPNFEDFMNWCVRKGKDKELKEMKKVKRSTTVKSKPKRRRW